MYGNYKNFDLLPLIRFSIHTLTNKSLATLHGEIVNPEITVKFEMRDVIT